MCILWCPAMPCNAQCSHNNLCWLLQPNMFPPSSPQIHCHYRARGATAQWSSAMKQSTLGRDMYVRILSRRVEQCAVDIGTDGRQVWKKCSIWLRPGGSQIGPPPHLTLMMVLQRSLGGPRLSLYQLSNASGPSKVAMQPTNMESGK